MTISRRQMLFSTAAGLAASSHSLPAFAQSSPINIAAGSNVGQSQAYFAQSQGIFQKHGLNTAVSVFGSGAANSAAVAGGSMHIGATTVLSLAQAHSHGLPFIALAPGSVHQTSVHTSALMVSAASPVTSVKGLNGKIIGVSTLSGFDELLVRNFADKSGGDATTLKFIEIPIPELYAALQQGRVDAINIEDPARQNAIDAGKIRILGDGEDAIALQFVEGVWFTTTDWLKANKDAAKRFQAAIYEAGNWAMQNPPKAAEVVAAFLKMTPAPFTQRYATALHLAEFQSFLDAGAKYKLIPQTAAATLVWDGS